MLVITEEEHATWVPALAVPSGEPRDLRLHRRDEPPERLVAAVDVGLDAAAFGLQRARINMGIQRWEIPPVPHDNYNIRPV